MVSFRAGKTTKSDGSNQVVAVDMPGSAGSPVVQAGDLLVVYAYDFGFGASDNLLTAHPNTWKRRMHATLANSDRGAIGVWYRVATAADAADPPPQYSFSVSDGAGQSRATFYAAAYQDAGYSLCGQLRLNTFSGGGAGPFATDSLDLILDNNLLAGFAGSRGTTTWSSSGHTERLDDTNVLTETGSLAVYDAAAVDTPPPDTAVSRTFTNASSVTSSGVGVIEIPDGTGTGAGPVNSPTSGSRSIETATFTSNTTSWVVNSPANVQEDDFVFVILARTTPSRLSSPPAGFAPLADREDATAVEVYMKRATASEPASYTFPVDSPGDIGNIMCLAYPGLNLACPVGDIVTATQPSSSTTHTSDTAVILGPQSWLLSIVSVFASGSGFTVSDDTGTDAARGAYTPGSSTSGIWTFDSDAEETQGASVSRTFTLSVSSSQVVSILIELVSAPGALTTDPPPVVDLNVDTPIPQLQVDAPPVVDWNLDTPTPGTYFLAASPVVDLNIDTPMLTADPAPSVDVNVDTPAPGAKFKAYPAAKDVNITALAPSAPKMFGILARLPEDGRVLPSARPSFLLQTKYQSSSANALMEVEVDNDPAFGSSYIMQAVPAVVDGLAYNELKIPVGSELAAGIYYWRARLSDDAGVTWLAYTSTRSFTVQTAGVGSTAEYGHWGNVDTSTPVPHFWFIRPGRGVPGDAVSLFGQSFGQSSVAVTMDGASAEPESSWSLVAANADAYTVDRVIDLVTGEVSPQHEVIVVAVPDIDAPGGAVYVVGS